MKIEKSKDGSGFVLTNQNGDSLAVSFSEFWEICRAGTEIDTKNEVQEYLSQCSDISGHDLDRLRAFPLLVDKITEQVIQDRINEETGDQIYYAAENCIESHISYLSSCAKVVVDLGYANLVAYRGADRDYKEVCVDLLDKDGNYLQDLAIIGGAYHYDADGEVVHDKGISVKLWGDVSQEDITHKFEIGVRDLEKEQATLDAQIQAASSRVIASSPSQEHPSKTDIFERS